MCSYVILVDCSCVAVPAFKAPARYFCEGQGVTRSSTIPASPSVAAKPYIELSLGVFERCKLRKSDCSDRFRSRGHTSMVETWRPSHVARLCDSGFYLASMINRVEIMDEQSTNAALSYRALQGTEIRLIKFGPSNSDADGSLTCSLEHVALDSSPVYFALSYVWGRSSIRPQIIVDGCSVSITASLFSALSRLRTWAEGDPERIPTYYIWADALCINQNDLEEKSKQVPRMKEIYQLARRVVAWLGPNNPEENHMVGCIFHQANKAGLTAASEVSEHPDDATIDLDEMANYPIVGELGNDFEGFNNTLCDLLARPWFGRVWIVQEMSLPRQTPLIFAGAYETSLENLLRIFLAVDKHQSAQKNATQSKKPSKAILAYNQIRLLYWGFIVEESTHARGSGDRIKQDAVFAQCFFEILIDITNGLGKLGASRPHDYLYGMMGLALGALRLEDLSPSLVPDYSLPFAEVFHRFTVFLIQRTRSLEILGCSKNELEGVPSWVPDFRFEGSRATVGQPEILDEPSFSDDLKKMSVVGVGLGSCQIVFPVTNGIRDGKVQLEEFEDKILRPASRVSGQEISELRANWIRSTAVMLDAVEESTHPLDYSVLGRRKVGDADSDVTEMLCRGLEKVSHFVLEKGIVGSLFSLDARLQLDDIVCVFKGSRQPSIIRRSGDSYIFVGAALLVGAASRTRFDDEFFSKGTVKTFVLA
jgi:hypothetical protein